MAAARPHLLGVDDAPFQKGQLQPVPIVGALMEGADLVEGVAVGAFPVDGDEVTEHLASWITGLRFHPSIQGVVLGGITIAGLGVVDAEQLAARLGAPILIVTRRSPVDAPLIRALESAGLQERIAVVRRSPRARSLADGLSLACAGIDPEAGARLVRAAIRKAQLPEPLRIAHLIARALVDGQSRGRV